MYTTALKSDDEMFHVALYDWLLCQRLPEKLLSVSCAFMFCFLSLYLYSWAKKTWHFTFVHIFTNY